jgi:6-phosphofructokinase 1
LASPVLIEAETEVGMATLAILVGGGPAPGINGVIGAATILARRRRARVLGIPNGFEPLIRGELDPVRELHIDDVSRIHLLGGSVLGTSRVSPLEPEAVLRRTIESLARLEVDHLLTIGGDGTAHVARRVSEAPGARFTLAHVPKTIDNDLPLPPGVPTFGYETARGEGARVIGHLLEDGRTSSRWYVVVMMGRSSGHLALGAAKAAGATLTILPEELRGRAVHLGDIARIVEGAMLKRFAMKRSHGVAVIAEGVAELLPESDFPDGIPRDKHGRPRFSELPFGDLVAKRAQAGLRELGIDLSVIDKDVGYELRCAEPNAFDVAYTRDLGAGAAESLLDGANRVMITRENDAIVRVPFADLLDAETGKTRVRYVDVAGRTYATSRLLQVRLETTDLEAGALCDAICSLARRSPEELRARYFG